MRPLVSVIIPTYNGSRYIASTIDSVLAQTYTAIEVIVVDDGSCDDTENIVLRYGDRIKYIRRDNRGPAAARNVGIRHSSGAYVSLLDHDDLLEPEKTEVQVDALETHPDWGMVYSYHLIVDEDGTTLPHEAPSHFPTGDVYCEFLRQNRITTFGETLIRRAVFDRIGFLDERREVMNCDDYDLWLRIAERYPIGFVEGCWVRYRVHDGNLSLATYQHYAAHLRVIQDALDRMEHLKAEPTKQLQRLVKENLAAQHARYANLFYFRHADYPMARRCYWRSWRLQPKRTGVLPKLAICCMPARGIEALRRMKRLLRF